MSQNVSGGNREPWKVLIVDDDEQVHRITRLVLKDIEFEGRLVQLIEANSYAEAIESITRHSDVAVAMIDVVMESHDAGLLLVDHIRNVLANRAIRIILRTGHPMAAHQRRIVIDYDVNDYRTKTELSSGNLFTCLITALRGYRDIRALECERLRWQRLAEAVNCLFKPLTVTEFANAALVELRGLLSASEPPSYDMQFDGAFVADNESRLMAGGTVVAGCGKLSSIVGQRFFKAEPVLAQYSEDVRSYRLSQNVIVLRLGLPASSNDSFLIVAVVGAAPKLPAEYSILEFFRLKASEALAQVIRRYTENIRHDLMTQKLGDMMIDTPDAVKLSVRI